MKYMTYQQEMTAKGRPMGGRPTWELRNMIKALNIMLPWLNTTEDLARMAEAKRELKIRAAASKNKLAIT